MSIERTSVGQQKSTEETPQAGGELIENVAGKFRMIYGQHNLIQGAEDLGSNYWAVDLEGPSWRAAELDGMKSQGGQMLEIIDKAAHDRKPIFSADINYRGRTLEAYADLFVPPLLAGGVALAAHHSLQDATGVSRRSFMKGVAYSGAGYIASSLLPGFLAGMVGDPRVSRQAAAITEAVNPLATDVIQLRNLIAAEKFEDIAKRYPAESKGKELAAVYGIMHAGISDALKMGQTERLAKLEPLLKNGWRGMTADDLAGVKRLDFSPTQKGWFVRDKWVNERIYALAKKTGRA